MFEIYPENYSHSRPFFVEIKKENNKKTFRLFRAHFLYSEEEWMKKDKHPFESNEMHPWNLGLEGELLDERYPNSITFWREDFVKFMVDSLNNQFEKNFKNE